MIALRNNHFLALAAVFLVAGCGSSQRKEGVQELGKLEGEVHGLHVLVSAGITKQDYSQRFEDVLLKLGDLDQSATETLPKFPQSEQPTVKAIYADLSQSIGAYKKARDYFGDSFEGYGCEEGCSFFPESEYDAVKQEFPTLDRLGFGPEYTWYRDNSGNIVNHAYRRSDMLQALWAVAGNEDDEAKQLIGQLSPK
jgi:hypothetical protein